MNKDKENYLCSDGEAFWHPLGFDTSKVKKDSEELDELLLKIKRKPTIVYYKGNINTAIISIQETQQNKVSYREFAFIKRGTKESIRGGSFSRVIYLTKADEDMQKWIEHHIR